MQQHLPFTVLKLLVGSVNASTTVSSELQQHLPFTVLKRLYHLSSVKANMLALQQHLPFTVLKLGILIHFIESLHNMLQQHLPFTVLKPFANGMEGNYEYTVATAPTVYGIETHI